MVVSERFEVERPRLVRIAAGILGDRHEAQDIVQLAWLRLQGAVPDEIRSMPAWLTTVTTRLCLDRLRAKVPEPVDVTAYASDIGSESGLDPLEEVSLADTVGVALHIVLESLSPSERVAFILHDTFGVDFDTVAQVLDSSPVAARRWPPGREQRSARGCRTARRRTGRSSTPSSTRPREGASRGCCTCWLRTSW